MEQPSIAARIEGTAIPRWERGVEPRRPPRRSPARRPGPQPLARVGGLLPAALSPKKPRSVPFRRGLAGPVWRSTGECADGFA